jgi:hypothetical protein
MNRWFLWERIEKYLFGFYWTGAEPCSAQTAAEDAGESSAATRLLAAHGGKDQVSSFYSRFLLTFNGNVLKNKAS